MPSAAKIKMSDAVAMPTIVFQLLPDFHSSGNVSSVIIDAISAKTMNKDVKLKNKLGFFNVT